MKFKYGDAVKVVGGTIFYHGVIGYIKQYEIRDKEYLYLVQILGSKDEIIVYEKDLEAA